MNHAYRCFERNARIADCTLAPGDGCRALVRELHVGLDTGKPYAPLPVEAGLAAAEGPVVLHRRCGRRERGAIGKIAIECIGAEPARAIADVPADVEAGPTPYRFDCAF